MEVVKDDVITKVSNFELCEGQDGGSEAAIHSMHDIFESNGIKAVLLEDAEKAFNLLHRQAQLIHIKYICPSPARFVYNCHSSPARL